MKSLASRGLLTGLLVIGFLLMGSFAFGQGKPIELTYSTHMPAPHANTLVSKAWAEEVEKRTNGRVKVTVFPGGTLLAPAQCYNGVIRGIADIGWIVLGVTPGRFPLTEVFDVPLGYNSGLGATRLMNEYYRRFKPKEFDETKVLYFHGHPRGGIHSKKPIEKVADFKGVKIRATGNTANIVTALGGTPVGMPINETYDALSRGVVDATCAAFDALKDWKFAEVAKYSIDSPGFGFTGSFLVFMNKNKWNALPPDIQQTIEKINDEFLVREGKTWDAASDAGREFGLKSGLRIINLSKEETEKAAAALKPLGNDYLQRMKKLGLPGDEAMKFVQDRIRDFQ
jgi:TRAP-type C4-dicarboxylate transport system substrate-binding protein